MLITTRQNGYSARVGQSGEESFLDYARKMGWNPRKSSRHEDMQKHIDCHIDIDGFSLSVDVKGCKRGIDSGLVLIELLNVNGDRGWIDGEADMIAFKIHTGWLFVSRETLAAYIWEKVGELKPENQSQNKRCVAPNWYRRHDRMDAITNVALDEIKGWRFVRALCSRGWSKTLSKSG